MPLAGYTVTQGKLSFVGVVIAGMVGSVLGALPLYYLGKMVGEERLKSWATKYGKWLTVSREDIEKSKAWFDGAAERRCFCADWVPGIRSLISIPAGIGEMNMGAFLLYSALGTGLWSALLAGAGYALGANFKQVDKYLSPASYVVLGAIVVAYLVRVFQQHKSQGKAAQ